jgi:hypothetical protein
LFTVIRAIFTPAYPVSNRTGSDGTVLGEDFDFRGRWDIALGDPAVEFGKVCNALGL